MSSGRAVVKAAASRRTPNWAEMRRASWSAKEKRQEVELPASRNFATGARLFCLEGVEISHQVAYSLLHNGLVVLVQGLEQRTPNWHIGRAMRSGAASKLQYGSHGISWILAIVCPGQLGQVGWHRFHR